MRTVVVMAVYLISFFPNPFHNWHWPWHKSHTYSTGSVSIQDGVDLLNDGSVLNLTDPEGNECLVDLTGFYYIGNDGSIGHSTRSCADAVKNGTALSPPVHNFDKTPIERLTS